MKQSQILSICGLLATTIGPLGCKVLKVQKADRFADDFLIRVHSGDYYELGVPSGYINTKGDTVIQIGKYTWSYTDTFRKVAVVRNDKLIAINRAEEVLFEVYWCDMGPDRLSDGLFRIVSNDRIGYADAEFNIVIPPQFTCAYPFENGKAMVANDCTSSVVDDGVELRSTWDSNHWFYIDKTGKRIE